MRAKLSLHERTYTCEHCGLVIDRDLKAAINLAAYGRRELDVAGSGLETVNARRGEQPRFRLKSPLKREDGTGSPDRTATASSRKVRLLSELGNHCILISQRLLLIGVLSATIPLLRSLLAQT